MKKDYSKELLQFISSHPSVFHVIEGQKSLLMASGYKQLLESEKWKLQKGGKYFVIRNGSAILAFRVPTAEFSGFMVMASHSDSPVLKVKENPDITVKGLYKKLNVELNKAREVPGRFDYAEGLEALDKCIGIDQSPIGRTPRSNPATYTGVFDMIRDLFASTPDAKAKGYSKGRLLFPAFTALP